jgi:simple sugar transport system permease protein
MSAPEAVAAQAEGSGESTPRSYRTAVIYAILGIAAFAIFGLTSPGDTASTLGMSTQTDVVKVPDLVVPARGTAIVLGLICLAIAAFAAIAAHRRWRVPAVLPYVYGVAWGFAFLVWAIAGKSVSFVSLLQGSLLLAVPLVFGSMAGILCERSGVINIAIEGQLLAGAFLSAVVATVTDSNWIGLVAAAFAGVVVSALLAVFTVKYAVNQIIVGVVLNVLVLGLTSFFYSQVLASHGSALNSPTGFPHWKVPVVGSIPVVGPILFDHTALVYLMYVAVIVLTILIYKSRWGLRMRAVGEHPAAADTVGIPVNRTRFVNVLYSGIVAGIGGAFFTLGSNIAFGKDMTAGKGYIALAAMIFGRWKPVGAFAAALLFGFADNLQNILKIIGTPLPSEFLQMAPYLVTIFAVAGLIGRSRPPAAEGHAYTKE